MGRATFMCWMSTDESEEHISRLVTHTSCVGVVGIYARNFLETRANDRLRTSRLRTGAVVLHSTIFEKKKLSYAHHTSILQYHPGVKGSRGGRGPILGKINRRRFRTLTVVNTNL